MQVTNFHSLPVCTPQGVPVVGCFADGVASIDSKGNIMNRDPGDDQAVAVLLGRMPGCEVRPLLHWDVSAGT